MGSFMSVLVVGCNLVTQTSTSVSSTAYPRVTLTTGRIPIRTSPPTPPLQISRAPAAASPTPANAAPQTPTVTPLLYIVQANDTLLDIAIRYDVELAALRAANADQDLSLLSIGMTLIIPAPPPPGVTATAPAPATSTPLALTLAAPTCYPARGGVLCLGVIENTGEVTLERAAVTVRLVSPAGQAMSAIAMIEQSAIPPGALAPYRVMFAAPAAPGWAISAELLSADAQEGETARPVVLPIEATILTSDRRRAAVATTIVNPTDRAIAAPRVVVTLLDETGRVVGYRVIMLNTAIAPNTRAAIRLDLPIVDGAASSVHVYAEGRGE